MKELLILVHTYQSCHRKLLVFYFDSQCIDLGVLICLIVCTELLTDVFDVRIIFNEYTAIITQTYENKVN